MYISACLSSSPIMSTFEVVPSPVMSSYTECVWTYANESGCGLPVPLPLVPVGMPWDAVFAKEGERTLPWQP